MVHHVYSVVRRDGGWAVEHMGKVLEVHESHDAAQTHAQMLAKLTQSGGHDAQVSIEGEAGGPGTDATYRKVRR